jgi:putative ABC transport system permease protein
MDVVAGNIAAAFPAEKAGWGLRLVSLHERYFGSARATILMLIGIISLVPLVACANVASLFMARAATRKTELASRLALGASRARVVRQLLSESLVVALGGGAVGLALAYGGGEALRSFAPAALPRLDTIGVDGNVLAFTLGASLLMLPLFGIVPALRATDMEIAETLKVGGGRGASDRRSGFRSGLVVAQVALSLMLMLASGLFLRSFLNLQGTNPGFQAENVLSFRTALPYFKYDTVEEIERVWDDVHGRLWAVPGVTAVGSIDRPPLSGSAPSNELWAEGRPPADAAEAMGGTRRFVTEGFFDVVRIPLLAGRVFEPTDGRNAPPVTVINETLAQQFFPGEDPIGKTLVFDWATLVNLEVIGVTADVAELGVGSSPIPILYLPARWNPRINMHFLVRTQGDPLESARALRQPDHVNPNHGSAAVRLIVPAEVPVRRGRAVCTRCFDPVVDWALRRVGLLRSATRSRDQHTHGVGGGNRRRHGTGAHEGTGARGRGGLDRSRWGADWKQVDRECALRYRHVRPEITYFGVSASLIAVALVACLVPGFRAVRQDPAEVLKAE